MFASPYANKKHKSKSLFIFWEAKKSFVTKKYIFAVPKKITI